MYAFANNIFVADFVFCLIHIPNLTPGGTAAVVEIGIGIGIARG